MSSQAPGSPAVLFPRFLAGENSCINCTHTQTSPLCYPYFSIMSVVFRPECKFSFGFESKRVFYRFFHAPIYIVFLPSPFLSDADQIARKSINVTNAFRFQPYRQFPRNQLTEWRFFHECHDGIFECFLSEKRVIFGKFNAGIRGTHFLPDPLSLILGYFEPIVLTQKKTTFVTGPVGSPWLISIIGLRIQNEPKWCCLSLSCARRSITPCWWNWRMAKRITVIWFRATTGWTSISGQASHWFFNILFMMKQIMCFGVDWSLFEREGSHGSISIFIAPLFFSPSLLILFWAAAPKGAMSYRIGGFCPVRTYVRPSVRPPPS